MDSGTTAHIAGGRAVGGWTTAPALPLMVAAGALQVGILLAWHRMGITTEFPRHALGVAAVGDGTWRLEHAAVDLTAAVIAGFPMDAERARKGLLLTAALLLLLKLVVATSLVARILVGVGDLARRRSLALGIVAALSFATALPRTHDAYLGQVPANAWHDPNTIGATTLVLAIAVAAMASEHRFHARAAGVIASLAALLVLVLPTAAVGLVCGLAASLLRRGPVQRWTGAVALIGAIGAAAVMQLIVLPDAGSRLQPGLLDGWSKLTGNVLVSLLMSGVGILVPLVAFPRELLRSRPWRFAAGGLAGSLLALAFLTQPKPASADSVLVAGATPWMYATMVVTFAVVARTWAERRSTSTARRGWIAVTAGSLHVAAGLAYLGAVLESGSYIT